MKQNYTIGIESITPAKAQAFLANFPRNRRSSTVRIDSYADIMKRGNWAPFSIVIVDENGNTVDGHHRLEAIIKSGVTVDMVVFRGLETKFVPFIDTGRPRSAGDMLAFVDELEGLSSLRNIAALARAVLYYIKKDNSVVIPPDELATFIVDNKDAVKAAYSDYVKIKPIGGTLSHAAALYILRGRNKEKLELVDAFVEQIAFGENIHSGMPTYAARNRIFANGGKHGGQVWRNAFYTILRAWCAFVNGEHLSQIKTTSASLENILKMDLEAK